MKTVTKIRARRGPVTASYKEFLVESLKDSAEAEAYLNAALADGDPRVFLLALRDVAEAQGIGGLAATAGLNRENVYRILSTQGNPRLSSIFALLQAMDLKLTVGKGQSAPKKFRHAPRALKAAKKSPARRGY